MKTLLIDQSAWDLVLTTNGDIAIASNPYAIAQDVASAIRTFKGELWYRTGRGIPYFARILGRRPSIGFVRQQLIKVALSVPEVVSAKCFLSASKDRTVTGQVQVTDSAGTVSVVGLGGSSFVGNIFILDQSNLDGGNVLG